MAENNVVTGTNKRAYVILEPQSGEEAYPMRSPSFETVDPGTVQCNPDQYVAAQSRSSARPNFSGPKMLGRAPALPTQETSNIGGVFVLGGVAVSLLGAPEFGVPMALLGLAGCGFYEPTTLLGGETKPIECDGNFKSTCLDASTIAYCLKNRESHIANCIENTHCDDGFCKTNDGIVDNTCTQTDGKLRAVCRVTDLMDFGEEWDHGMNLDYRASHTKENCSTSECASNKSINVCGDDDGVSLGFDWIGQGDILGINMEVEKSSYYQVQPKISWEPVYGRGYKLKIEGPSTNFLAPDCENGLCANDKYKEYNQYCQFSLPAVILSGPNRDANSVALKISPVRDNYSGEPIIFTKLRIWSCSCE